MNSKYRNLLKSALSVPTIIALFAATPAHALDLTKGAMASVPLKNGQAPSIDGDLKDWDLSGAEPVWIAPETASLFNGEVSLMHDSAGLPLRAALVVNEDDGGWRVRVLKWNAGIAPNSDPGAFGHILLE